MCAFAVCVHHMQSSVLVLFLVLPSSIKSEAAVNSDVARSLVPHISTAASSLERVFPDNHISEVRAGVTELSF